MTRSVASDIVIKADRSGRLLDHQNVASHISNSTLFPPTVVMQVCEAITKALDNHSTQLLEFIRKDRKLTYLEACITPFEEDLALIIIRDISNWKHFEQELIQAKEAAELANQAKSEFFSRMSHELRTPLNAILGYAQLLEMDELDEDTTDSVQRILHAGRHLLDLLNEVLDVSRIDTGKLALSLEPVSMLNITSEALDLITPIAKQKQVDVIMMTETLNSIYIRADLQRVKQVVLNILSNAVKYNCEGGKVEISGELVQDHFFLSVRDTGLGIDPAKMDRVFTAFDRLGAEDTGVEGSGIGLALSQRLVHLMNGAIDVSSQVGEGSTFRIRLPLDFSPQLDPTEPAETPVVTSKAAQTILYIEDNFANLNLIKRLLKRFPNIKLLTAMQGQLGLEIAQNQQPDLVLLDLHLPVLSGEEVLQKLKSDISTKHIPVIIISADATAETQARVLDLGADDYLSKPIDVPVLLERLHEFIAGN